MSIIEGVSFTECSCPGGSCPKWELNVGSNPGTLFLGEN